MEYSNGPDWLHTIQGVLVTLLGWMGIRIHRKQDHLEARMTAHEILLPEHYVKRDEFKNVIEAFRTERKEMHAENKETLERIHERVDELWQRDR